MAENKISYGWDPVIRHLQLKFRGTPIRTFLFIWLMLFIILSGAVSYLQIFNIKKNTEYAARSAEKAAALLSFQLNNVLHNQNEDELKSYFVNLTKSEKTLVIVLVRTKEGKSFTCINDKYETKIEKYDLKNFLNGSFSSGISRTKELIIVHQPVVHESSTIGWINAAFDTNGGEGVSSISNYVFSGLFSGVISVVITFLFISFAIQSGKKNQPEDKPHENNTVFDTEIKSLSNSVKTLTAAFRKTKEELADSQVYATAIIQAMESAIFVIGNDRMIRNVNKSACNLLGYPQEELLGKDLALFLHEDESAGISIENLIDKGSLKKVPAEFIRKDKETVSVSLSGSVIYHGNNEIQDIICIADDVSERKEAEAAIIRAHDELEIRVAERTFELEEINKALKAENKERLETEKKLTSMLDEKEVLLKEIHHRVKNNLQIISSLLQLNTTKIKDKESLEVFKASQMRIKSIAMVHERLYQSKDLAVIDIKDYVNVLTKDLFTLFGGKAAGIKILPSIVDVRLNIDKTVSLGLILNELLTNSIKYAFPENTGGEIAIEISRNEPNGYKLFYKDNGVGFPCENIAETNTLGLRLIRSLTRQLDGTLDIKNENGVQYTIVFTQD